MNIISHVQSDEHDGKSEVMQCDLEIFMSSLHNPTHLLYLLLLLLQQIHLGYHETPVRCLANHRIHKSLYLRQPGYRAPQSAAYVCASKECLSNYRRRDACVYITS